MWKIIILGFLFMGCVDSSEPKLNVKVGDCLVYTTNKNKASWESQYTSKYKIIKLQDMGNRLRALVLILEDTKYPILVGKKYTYNLWDHMYKKIECPKEAK